MKKGKLIELVYAANFTKRATAVALYLINRVNRNLTCFPAVGTIARECSMGKRTAIRAIKDLVEEGFVKKESRFHKNGGQRSNFYTLLEEPEPVFVKVDFNNYDGEGDAKNRSKKEPLDTSTRDKNNAADVNVHGLREADEDLPEEPENGCMRNAVEINQVSYDEKNPVVCDEEGDTKNRSKKEPLDAYLRDENNVVDVNVYGLHEVDEDLPEESGNGYMRNIISFNSTLVRLKKWIQLSGCFHRFVAGRGCKFGTP
ncbi:MAG: hypothetical protein COA82_10720 [Alkaliphilus sp.]|nr:MAG: hypothetical protein COA82_10720 [Alkaliphilus sp.]